MLLNRHKRKSGQSYFILIPYVTEGFDFVRKIISPIVRASEVFNQIGDRLFLIATPFKLVEDPLVERG